MRRIGAALASGAAGYAVGAVAGYVLVSVFSSNVHDRELEAAMTGAFVAGPAGALIGVAAGLAWVVRMPRPPGRGL